MKTFLLILFAVGSVAFASAQVKFGVKAGVNLSNITYSGNSSGVTVSSKTDFHAGLLVAVPLFAGFYLQPEVIYSGQGASSSDSGMTAKINYGYINVPVLFKYQSESGLFVETGPQVGFLLSAKEKVAGQTFDVKTYSQSVDFSWAFGVGYKIPVINLGIDARYNLGLTNINKGSVTGNAKNSVFQFGLFYLFP